MQAVILYFIKKYNEEMAEWAETFLMKKIVEENVLSAKFLIDWYKEEQKLDKKSSLKDKKAEKKFRKLISNLIDHLNVDSDSSSEDSNESDGEEKKEADEKPQGIQMISQNEEALFADEIEDQKPAGPVGEEAGEAE